MSGCSSFQPTTKAYDTQPFDGVRKLSGDPGSPPVRIFLIHGISNHEPGWALKYLEPVAKELGWSLDKPGAPVPVDLPSSDKPGMLDTTNDYSAKLQVDTMTQDGRLRAVAYELTWSPLTEYFKKTRLSPDDALGPQRALVNRLVKSELLNEEMSDVVLYLAHYDRDILRRSVAAALRHFYLKDYDPPAVRAADANPVVFISESLGSMMLYGELMEGQRRFADGSQAQNADEARDKAGFRDMTAHSRLFFMMANQLPLLDVDESTRYDHVPAEAEKTPPAHTQDFFKSLAASDNGGPPIDVVAFSDVNDLLSYPLDPDDVAGLTNVRLHVFAPVNTMLGFPLFERPDWAHNNYAGNPQVTDIVVNGYSGKRSQ